MAYALAIRWHVHGHASCCARRRAGHQRRPERAAASNDQGGGAIGHGRQCARPMSRCLGHLVSSLPPPSNSAIGPALWPDAGPSGPTPGSRWSPRSRRSRLGRPRRRRRRRGGMRCTPASVGPGGSSRRVGASAERGRVQGPGRAEADLGPSSARLCPACRAEQGNLARRPGIMSCSRGRRSTMTSSRPSGGCGPPWPYPGGRGHQRRPGARQGELIEGQGWQTRGG